MWGLPKERSRLGEAAATTRISGVAEAMDGGADVFVDGPKSQDEQELRGIGRDERGVRLRCDEPLDGKAVSLCLGVFRRFLTSAS